MGQDHRNPGVSMFRYFFIKNCEKPLQKKNSYDTMTTVAMIKK